MTDTEQTSPAAAAGPPASDGAGPPAQSPAGGPAIPAPDMSERFMGALAVLFGVGLILIGIDLATGGAFLGSILGGTAPDD